MEGEIQMIAAIAFFFVATVFVLGLLAGTHEDEWACPIVCFLALVIAITFSVFADAVSSAITTVKIKPVPVQAEAPNAK